PTPRRANVPPTGAATMDSQTSQSSQTPQVPQQPHTFQVDLRGLVDLLSHHLYSSPKVYLRELLQNAVDAITARRAEQPDAPARPPPGTGPAPPPPPAGWPWPGTVTSCSASPRWTRSS